MILSKASFFHKKYLSMYTYEMPSSIREYVTKNRFFLNDTSIYVILFYFQFFLSPSPFANHQVIPNRYVYTRNCEDIAMSFLVANATGAPPIWVKGNNCSVGLLSTSNFCYVLYYS